MHTEIKIAVLESGVSIMGEIESWEDGILISRPVIVTSIPPSAENPRTSVGFVPFLEYTKEFKTGINIPRKQLLSIVTPVDELETKYRSIFSGIILP